MDPHQAAFWLDRSPAEAAEFLAKTAVASRRVGGFAKRAAPDLGALLGRAQAGGRALLDRVTTNPDARNALIGAGVGGLGGLGLGMINRRRQNPLASALTGAALGGTLGGAGSYLYNHPDALGLKRDAAGDDAAALLDRQQAAARAGQSSAGRLFADMTQQAPTPQPGGVLARQLAGESTLGNVAGAVSGDRPLVAAGLHGGLAYVQKQHFDNTRAFDQVQGYMRNAPEDDPLKQKLAPGYRQDVTDQAASFRNKVPLVGGLLPDTAKATAGRTYADAAAGRAPAAHGVPGTSVDYALAQGGSKLPRAGFGRSALRGLMYAAPHLAIQGGLNYANRRPEE